MFSTSIAAGLLNLGNELDVAGNEHCVGEEVEILETLVESFAVGSCEVEVAQLLPPLPLLLGSLKGLAVLKDLYCLTVECLYLCWSDLDEVCIIPAVSGLED